jgi:dethiobiotin synthetase
VIRYFVTGTDTGVGKTFVTCWLARQARSLGRSVFAFKPIETGVVGELGEDQQALVDAAGGWQTGRLRGLVQLPMPAAPLVAARAVGRTIDLEPIVALIRSRSEEVILVEGAGGWRVPITDTVDIAGLASRLGFPVVVAARAGLGTISHSLLTVEAIERDGLTVAAVVLSERPEDDRAMTDSNMAEIRRRWPGQVARQTDLESLLRST